MDIELDNMQSRRMSLRSEHVREAKDGGEDRRLALSQPILNLSTHSFFLFRSLKHIDR
jgi:hypothetical protein